MTAGAAEFLERDFFASHGLDHIGTGNEHVRLLAHHKDEVGHCRAVHRATGTWAEDHADLWDHT